MIRALAFGIFAFLTQTAAQAGDWGKLTELTPSFFTRAQVCEAAKADSKPYALIAIKSHACDFSGYQHCLKETYYVADSCNAAVQENFAVYHLRLMINARKEWSTTSDWSEATHATLTKEWGIPRKDMPASADEGFAKDAKAADASAPQLEPEWVLVDVASCSIITRMSRDAIHTAESYTSGKMLTGPYVGKDELLKEYEHLSTQLVQAMGPTHTLAHDFDSVKTQACLATDRPSLIDLWDHIDGQHKTPPSPAQPDSLETSP